MLHTFHDMAELVKGELPVLVAHHVSSPGRVGPASTKVLVNGKIDLSDVSTAMTNFAETATLLSIDSSQVVAISKN